MKKFVLSLLIALIMESLLFALMKTWLDDVQAYNGFEMFFLCGAMIFLIATLISFISYLASRKVFFRVISDVEVRSLAAEDKSHKFDQRDGSLSPGFWHSDDSEETKVKKRTLSYTLAFLLLSTLNFVAVFSFYNNWPF